MKIFIIGIICLYAAINIGTTKTMNVKEMKEEFIDGQCIIGRIAANIFYAPAWITKGLKFIIWMLVK